MQEPAVVVILVNYNNAQDTIASIRSLKDIDYINYEIVVVDNASTDSSLQILSPLAEEVGFKLMMSNVNAGFSAGNNIGIKYALTGNAEYILLLNNDTLVEPDFLTKIVGYAEECTECDAAIGKILYESYPDRIWYAGGSISSVTSRTIHYHYGEQIEKDLLKKPSEVTFATGCFLLLRRSTVESVGLLNEDYFLYEEDCDYCIRIRMAGKRIYYVPDSVIYHKVSASTGAASPMTQYYTTRNHLLLIMRHYSGWRKMTAMAYTVCMLCKRGMLGELQWKHILRGVADAVHGKTGKCG